MKNKIKQLEEELHEQCVLNGKGAEREAALLGKLERLERENAELHRDKQMLQWLLDNCSTFVTVDNTGSEPEIYIIEATREAIEAEVEKG
jgi:ribosomal protein S12 methylthiotransferase accessory factor YcaO